MLLLKRIAWLIKDAKTVQKNVDLLIDGARIAAVGPRLAAPANAETLDCSGCAVMPGLVNAHTHLWQLIIAGRRDDLPLDRWCDSVLAPAIRALYAEKDADKRARRAYVWTALGTIEMLRSGVTSYVDMDLPYGQDGMFSAAQDAGVRGYFGAELADGFLGSEGLARDLARVRSLAALYPERCILTPSEPNLVSAEAFPLLARFARETGMPVQIHVNETAGEARRCVNERGYSELVYLDRFGLLSSKLSAVHGVHLRHEEIDLAAARGVTIVYNPKSNAKLGSGVCPVGTLKKAGVNLSLATDGPGSNDRLDLFEEMRAGVMLQRAVQSDVGALGARDVFHMATWGGARMLGLEGGALRSGLVADCAVVPLDRAHLSRGSGDPISTLVYCARAGDVRDVIVAGRFALRGGCAVGLDEASLTQEFSRMLAELKEAGHV